MSPYQILSILRARYKISLLVAFLTVVAVIGVALLLPKQYTAMTSVMVDVKSPDPISAVMMPPLVAGGTLPTQIDIIRSDRVTRKVIGMMGLNTSPAVTQMWKNATDGKGKIEDWVANLLQKNLAVTPSRDSNVIYITYRGVDPVFAAGVANAFAQGYVDASVELKVEPARQYARWFAEQSKTLRDNVEKAQTRLTEYQQQNGIVVASEENVDYEMAKLNDLSARLTAVQNETTDAESKQRLGRGDALKEVMQDTVVAGLRANIAQLEGKLKDAAGNLGVNHPQYKRMESELAELKDKLAQETRRVASGYTATTTVGKSNAAELRAAIEAQKIKLLKIKKQRDELAVLMRDADSAKKAYEAVANRYTQTNLESQATQTNVSVLTPAIEPLEPSFPKPLPIMILMGIALGIVAGVGAAFGWEFLDRRIRTVRDLSEMLQLPVLGVIERPKKRSRIAVWNRSVALLPK